MSWYLHYSEIKWLNKKEIDKFDVDFISENSLDGYIYILEVSLIFWWIKWIA